MKAYNVSGLMVLKDGKIVLERYGLGRKPRGPLDLLLGRQVGDLDAGRRGDPGRQDQVARRSGHPLHPRAEGLGLRGRHRAPAPDDELGREVERGLHRPQLRRRPGRRRRPASPASIPIVSYMRRLPRANEPGTKFHYNTGETDLVGILVSKAVGKSLAALRLGEDLEALRHGARRDLDARPGGPRARRLLHVHDAARLWAVRPVHRSTAARRAASRSCPTVDRPGDDGQQITNGARRRRGYGYFWWIGQGGAYEAVGIFGQSITIFPDERLVIVINSAWPTATGRDLFAARSAFINAVRDGGEGPWARLVMRGRGSSGATWPSAIADALVEGVGPIAVDAGVERRGRSLRPAHPGLGLAHQRLADAATAGRAVDDEVPARSRFAPASRAPAARRHAGRPPPRRGSRRR